MVACVADVEPEDADTSADAISVRALVDQAKEKFRARRAEMADRAGTRRSEVEAHSLEPCDVLRPFFAEHRRNHKPLF